MVHYINGKIYKIEAINGADGDVYYGSTTRKTLAQRMSGHRKDYKRYKDNKQRLVTSFNLFDKYGIENCNIFLVENFPCETKDELTTREAFYIQNYLCVNKLVPYRNPEENMRLKKDYYEKNKYEIIRKNSIYREVHKDEYKHYLKNYCEEHKDELKEKKRHYVEDHKEEIKEYQKQYRNEHYQNKKEYNRLYYEKKKNELKAYANNYYQMNKEDCQKRHKLYYENTKNNNKNNKLGDKEE